MNVLVTGSSGLVGGQAVRFFDALGFQVCGVDNNMRKDFFGEGGDTTLNRRRLEEECNSFTYFSADIRHRTVIYQVMRQWRPELIVHAAAQKIFDIVELGQSRMRERQRCCKKQQKSNRAFHGFLLKFDRINGIDRIT